MRGNEKAVAAEGAVEPAIASRTVHAALRGVAKRYRAADGEGVVEALGPVDLELYAGEFVAVVGPSGCGKTTLLETLAGLTPASEGSVLFEGREVKGRVPDGVGVVFQEDACLPWLSVWDNIAFGLRRAGAGAADVRARVDYAVSFMGLGTFAGSYPAQLSGGMRQRVCIARTLVLEPRLILLDEPFGALDQQTRLLMGDEVLRLWRETKSTILLITHAIDEGVMLADRVGVMSARPGRFIELVETGWPAGRDSRIVEEEAFGRLTAHVWSKLRAESLKALGRTDAAAAAGGSA
ncbi:MAG: ABC transporter ATP-binding protein [Alphaproteobacteria bacterium]